MSVSGTACATSSASASSVPSVIRRLSAPVAPAHDAMQAALGEGEVPTNDGFTFGWVWSYPMKALLEQAASNGDMTRQGMRDAVEGLVVDYEGALPERTFGEGGEDVKTVYLSTPDPEAPLKISTIEADYAGSTADGYDYSAPCAGSGS